MPSQIPSAAESAGRAAAPRPSAADEQALLAAVLQKDRKAAAEFVSRYADPIYAYVWRRLAPATDLVEDVVQEVFLAALDKLHTFAGESTVLGWLLGIARHKVEDVYRARLREPEPLGERDLELADAHPTGPRFDEQIDAARAAEKTRHVLARLPAAYGAALRWRYWDKCSLKEMATQTGRSEKAMERLLARARAQFKRLWEDA